MFRGMMLAHLLICLLASCMWQQAVLAYPFWGEPQSLTPTATQLQLNRKLADYIKQRDLQACEAAVECVGFYGRYLENANNDIATEAFGYVSNLSFENIRNSVDFFPLAKLRRWVADAKIDATHRDFYCLVLGLKKQYADRSLISARLDEVLANDAAVPLIGTMLGYTLSGSNFSQQMLLKVLQLKSTSAAAKAHRLEVLTAVDFLKQQVPESVENWSSNIIRAALILPGDVQLQGLSLAQSWNDTSHTQQLHDLISKGNASEAFKQEAINYCTAIKDDHCQRLVTIIEHPPTLTIPETSVPEKSAADALETTP